MDIRNAYLIKKHLRRWGEASPQTPLYLPAVCKARRAYEKRIIKKKHNIFHSQAFGVRGVNEIAYILLGVTGRGSSQGPARGRGPFFNCARTLFES